MADPNADTRLAACEKRFRSAKVSGEWQEWISETERPWSIPPWRPLAALVVRERAKATDGGSGRVRRYADGSIGPHVTADVGTLQPRAHGGETHGAGQIGKRSNGRAVY